MKKAAVKRTIFLTVGILSLTIGLIGLLLPLLPTTPFLLLAAFCFSKSSERFHRWLLTHRVLGPYIQNWQRYKIIPLRAKVVALVMIAISFFVMISREQIPDWAKIAASTILLGAALYVGTRASKRKS